MLGYQVSPNRPSPRSFLSPTPPSAWNLPQNCDQIPHEHWMTNEDEMQLEASCAAFGGSPLPPLSYLPQAPLPLHPQFSVLRSYDTSSPSRLFEHQLPPLFHPPDTSWTTLPPLEAGACALPPSAPPSSFAFSSNDVPSPSCLHHATDAIFTNMVPYPSLPSRAVQPQAPTMSDTPNPPRA